MIRRSKEDLAEIRRREKEHESLIEKIRLEFKNDPRSANWPGNRQRSIAEIAVTLKVYSAEEWFTRGPKLEFIK